MRISSVFRSVRDAREWLYRYALGTLAAVWMLSYLPWYGWLAHRAMVVLYQDGDFLPGGRAPLWCGLNIGVTMWLMLLFFWGPKAPQKAGVA